ncbi:MAG: prolipoprotein diacylglyceryl transferase [Erysipelotrichaceae bacterium]|nr:prolipoprotein diacylglyceryl transferase [Erysipelotrichaceae bacterium]
MIQFFPNEQTFVALKIFGLSFDIRWYAVFIMIGALLAYEIAKKDVKKARYISLDFFDSFFIYTLWVGIIGARLWFCAFYNFSYYFSNPVEIIRVWDGGLAIQGGIVFGALFAYFYTKKNRYSFLKILDIVLPNVLLGQFTGRWGNFVNKECHGAEVSEEYFNGILSFLKEGMYINGHYYEPLFFYESMLCLLGWILIYLVLKKRQNRRGDLAYAYLMWYGLIRFFIEGRRTDSLYLGNFKMAQLTSIAFFILGLLGYLGVLNRFLKKEKPTLLFDFDGTLMDTRESIVEAYRALFKKYSDESLFTDEIKQEIIGPALRPMFAKYFPGFDYDTLYADYHDAQIKVAKTANHPTPHSDEVLKKLHEQGYKIGIISTRSKPGIQGILDDFGLREYVDDICGVYDVEKQKPDPEGIFKLVNENKWNRECIMVGDSLMDIKCGDNYGAYTVAYLNDPLRSEQLKQAANEAITDMEDIYDILNKDIAFTYDKM